MCCDSNWNGVVTSLSEARRFAFVMIISSAMSFRNAFALLLIVASFVMIERIRFLTCTVGSRLLLIILLVAGLVI